MSLKGIRKALNNDGEAQAQSLLKANKGKLPLVTVRHKEPRQAVYFQSSNGRWQGWVARYSYAGLGQPLQPVLSYIESDKKPRAGVIMDGKPHEVKVCYNNTWYWTKVIFDSPLYEDNGTWYYSGKKVIEVFSKLWGLNCPRELLAKCQKTYQKAQEGKGVPTT